MCVVFVPPENQPPTPEAEHRIHEKTRWVEQRVWVYRGGRGGFPTAREKKE